MTQAANTILESLLGLPDADRAELAARLLDSLDPPAEPGAEAGWAEELRARAEEVRTGQVRAVPWSEARARILSDADGDR